MLTLVCRQTISSADTFRAFTYSPCPHLVGRIIKILLLMNRVFCNLNMPIFKTVTIASCKLFACWRQEQELFRPLTFFSFYLCTISLQIEEQSINMWFTFHFQNWEADNTVGENIPLRTSSHRARIMRSQDKYSRGQKKKMHLT